MTWGFSEQVTLHGWMFMLDTGVHVWHVLTENVGIWFREVVRSGSSFSISMISPS